MVDWARLYGPAVLAWLFVLVKILSQLRRRSTRGSTIWILLGGVACSMTAQTPGVYHALAEVSGIPNLGRLVAHGTMLAVAWAAQEYLLRANQLGLGPAVGLLRSKRWFLAVMVMMCVCFALADTPVDDVRFAGRYGAEPWVLEYWLVFVAAIVPAFGNIVRLSSRYAARSEVPAWRYGLRFIAVGTASALLYHVHKAVVFAADRFDFRYPEPISDQLDRFLPPLAAVLVLIGAMLPWWMPRPGFPAIRDWFTRYRTYQRLRPLWLALYRTNPEIALFPPRPILIDLLPSRDLSLRLYRRVIEIRDGRLSLQPHLDPGIGSTVRTMARRSGVSGRKLDAMAEAATLLAAIRSHATGSAPLPAPVPVAVPGGRDLESDTAFLTEVARAYRKLS
ncbi:MAB_1171c family putative transporter [Amycolatopsis sp. YIM 10]|uniref:MAB_1171c family putative transporter n=1 Tax=Amycolatopsis sp. YIM 10 TaxID=2653857 RepID=UPI00128FECE1|nr:MAB_1171c family putative transporter [Amycolatopsis sp. YIM 10]QFU87496.1 hypothetical protein YIM_11470 [Amycolatopsis sp. YIM 10]